MENVYYTGSGDDGQTSVGGKRVGKDDPLMDCMGNIDELISTLGVLRSIVKEKNKRISGHISELQDTLFSINSEIAASIDRRFLPKKRVSQTDLSYIEDMIKEIGNGIPKMTQFVLPGGNTASGYADLCRAVCRRAERSYVFLSKSAVIEDGRFSITERYLNRLSSCLFWIARYLCFSEGEEELHPTG